LILINLPSSNYAPSYAAVISLNVAYLQYLRRWEQLLMIRNANQSQSKRRACHRDARIEDNKRVTVNVN